MGWSRCYQAHPFSREELNEVTQGRSMETNRGATYGARYSGADGSRGTSWLSVVFGWLTAFGAGLILSGIVGEIIGATSWG
jgi:hypothetical protein